MALGATGQVKTCSIALPANAADGSCTTAKGVSLCGPAKATDSTYTKNAAGIIQWALFSTLTAASPVVNCATGLWSTLGVVGAAVPSTPPVPPPASTHDYTVLWGGGLTGILVSHSSDAGKTWDTPVSLPANTPSYVYKALPSAVTQCFKVAFVSSSGNSDFTTSCVGSQAITVQ